MRLLRSRAVLATVLAATALPTASAHAETAYSADAFVDSIGVNTHVIYGDTSYGDFPLVRDRLKELGVRHIRDGVCGQCPWSWWMLRQLGQNGLKLNAIAGRPDGQGGTLDQNLAAIKGLGPMVDALEGANEWDSFSGRAADWVTVDRAWQQRLWQEVQADPDLRSIPVIGPSLIFSWETPSSWDRLGDVSQWATYGNSHGYAGGRPPEVAIDAELARARQITGSKPVFVTEGGYHNAIQQANNDHPPVPEDIAAAYLPRMFLENFRRGIVRTYSYELMDERPGAALTDQEQSFGLVRADGSRKPAFVALRNLIAALADPGPAVADVDVPLTVESAAPDLHHLLLHKRDGEVDVVLWRARSQWNPSTRTRQTVDSATVTLTAGTAPVRARLVTPQDSALPQPLAASGASVSVAVGAAPVVVQLTAPADAPSSAPASSTPPAGMTPGRAAGRHARPCRRSRRHAACRRARRRAAAVRRRQAARRARARRQSGRAPR